MTDPLNTYLEQYAKLERGVRELVHAKANALCEQCTRCCCDVIICREAMDSPFLTQVHRQTERFSERDGFLTETGCALQQGRPPVCYTYFCDDHFYHQPDELHAEVLKVLGTLLQYATQNALDDTPLEDVTDETLLEQIDFQSLEKQLQESSRALEIIRAFYRNGILSEASFDCLRRIRLSGED